MVFTFDEQEQFFKDRYGCNPNDALASARQSVMYETNGIIGLATAMLGDVQEMIFLGDNEEARKRINLVKFFLNKDMDK